MPGCLHLRTGFKFPTQHRWNQNGARTSLQFPPQEPESWDSFEFPTCVAGSQMVHRPSNSHHKSLHFGIGVDSIAHVARLKTLCTALSNTHPVMPSSCDKFGTPAQLLNPKPCVNFVSNSNPDYLHLGTGLEFPTPYGQTSNPECYSLQPPFHAACNLGQVWDSSPTSLDPNPCLHLLQHLPQASSNLGQVWNPCHWTPNIACTSLQRPLMRPASWDILKLSALCHWTP